jgi:hypothetical protein
MERHHVIPPEVAREAGIARPKVIRLCPNCRQELEEWYSVKVANMAYDTNTKRFIAKSWPELAKEYQFAYDSFVKYKREQKRSE